MNYTIKKGRHYSMPPHFRPHFGITEMKFRFRFSKECIYPVKGDDDYDMNKLFGWSYGYHHIDSVRIGWVPESGNSNLIKLYLYYYNSGRRTVRFLLTLVPAEKWYEASIEIIGNQIRASISGNDAFEAPFIMPPFKWGYFLYPYFGGNNTAPKDMSILVERIS